jgi:hypothetical protein
MPARAIWAHEVYPALSFNLDCVAGEWTCWDRDWLIESIGKVRARGVLGRMLDRTGAAGSGRWGAIELCMRALLEAPPERREELSRDRPPPSGPRRSSAPGEYGGRSSRMGPQLEGHP